MPRSAYDRMLCDSPDDLAEDWREVQCEDPDDAYERDLDELLEARYEREVDDD